MSKFSLDTVNRCVYPHFRCADDDVLLGAVFGEDVALTRVGDHILASHVDPIVGAVQDIGWLAVHVACNDIATCGATVRWILPLVLVPSKNDEDLLEKIMRDVARTADELNVTIIGGHTGYSANLSRPLVAVTALGILTDREPILTKGAQVGDHVLISKGIALEGTAILASDFAKTARQLGLPQGDINEAKRLMGAVSVIPEADILAQHGATSMHDVTRGGLLETLQETASLSDVGIQVQFDRIPIPAVVQRFGEAFVFDPLKMISSGTLVATIPPEHLDGAMVKLEAQGILCADIGEVIPGQGVKVVRQDQVSHYQEIHPEDDELARLWMQYYPDVYNSEEDGIE
jgi:hydrogenase expression/formation protein HypE